MTVTNRQVMEQQMARCGVRDRYVCSFPRRHECRTGLIPDKSTVSCNASRRTATRRTSICRLRSHAGALHCVTVTY
jgi:hypothetical protein